MRLLKASALYFALVFGAGFALGPVRVLLLVPRVGERPAELLEMPVMLAVLLLAARLVVRRLVLPPRAALGAGLMALGLLLLAEALVVLLVRKETLADYVAGRDPVAGAAYLAMLGIFALAPLLAARRRAVTR